MWAEIRKYYCRLNRVTGKNGVEIKAFHLKAKLPFVLKISNKLKNKKKGPDSENVLANNISYMSI